MQPDVIEQIYGQTIQHGRYNDRIYLMKYNHCAGENVPRRLMEMAQEMGYSKIFAKSGLEGLPLFIEQGFTVEAIIPAYFRGGEILLMACFYLAEQRAHEKDVAQADTVLKTAKAKADAGVSKDNDAATFTVRACRDDDVEHMASIYRRVFPSYPFPIHDPDYLRRTMAEHVDYYCVEVDGRIVALSSAEIDSEAQSAEMTDFATLPPNRGHGHASRLLSVMETKTRKKGVQTFYTIARALSPGMNITFARHGYRFGGRLKNNTNISGSIESMHVWYKG